MTVSTSSGEPGLEVEAVSLERVPYKANEPTIVAAQVSDHLVQVTPHGVLVLEPRQGVIAANWSGLEPSQTVLVAACTGNDILVGTSDGTLLALKIEFPGTGAAVNVVE